MLRSIYLLSFLLLQSLFAFAGNVKENVPSSFDLYVCIGQSNMAGRATLTPEVMVSKLFAPSHFPQFSRISIK